MTIGDIPVSAPGSLYVVQFISKVIKVGISGAPRNRLRALALKHGVIRKFHVYAGISTQFNYRLERRCLARFCGAGSRIAGEWECFTGISFPKAKRIVEAVIAGSPCDWFVVGEQTSKPPVKRTSKPTTEGDTMNKSTAVKKAKSAYRLAQILGITRQAVSRWGVDVPAQQVVKLRELRPQWFPKPVQRKAPQALCAREDSCSA